MAVPGGQDLCQILQDDDVYQQYRLTRQGSDFDSQSAFHINVSVTSGWLFESPSGHGPVSVVDTRFATENRRCVLIGSLGYTSVSKCFLTD